MAKGSIYPYRLADGSVRYMAVFRTSNGVQRKKKGFQGVREAERFLNKTMADVDAGGIIATDETFAAYIDAWLAQHRPRIEEGTYRDYRVHIERRLKPFFGDLKLGDIKTTHVRRYVADLVAGTAPTNETANEDLAQAMAVAAQLNTFTIKQFATALNLARHRARYLAQRLERSGMLAEVGEQRRAGRRGRSELIYRASGRGAQSPNASRPISPKTINNSLIVLRVSLGHAVEDGLIARNPAASTPGARERIKVAAEQPDMDFLRLSEIPQYLDGCSPDYRPLAEVLIACGLRISEALELSWSQVDLDNSMLLVTGSRKPGHGSADVRGGTKGDRFRGVQFGPRVNSLLRDLRARQAEYGTGQPQAQAVFVGANGRRPDRREISRVDHKHALRDAGLRGSLRLHDLRHTAAASWLAAGLPLIYVQQQLGHASITTTERQYGHLERSFLRDAAHRAEAAIWGGQPAHLAEFTARSS